MRLRLVFSLLSTVAFAPHLFAQSETPRYEVFGGYSYSRLADSYSTLEGTRFHGWNASVTKNLNRWLGVVADVSGHYSSESFAEGFFFTNSANLLAYRFGPKFSVADALRLSPKLWPAVSAFTGKESIFRASRGVMPKERRMASQSQQVEGWTSRLQTP